MNLRANLSHRKRRKNWSQLESGLILCNIIIESKVTTFDTPTLSVGYKMMMRNKNDVFWEPSMKDER